jgi:hypothetical protein
VSSDNKRKMANAVKKVRKDVLCQSTHSDEKKE